MRRAAPTAPDVTYGGLSSRGTHPLTEGATLESDGPERAPTTGISQYGALLPGDGAIRMR